MLVNNAAGGDARDGPVADITTEAWDAILRVDLTAPMWCARAAIPHMRTRRSRRDRQHLDPPGRTRESRASPRTSRPRPASTGSPGPIAVEEAEHGIRCNTISPGYVLNDRRDADLAPERRARSKACT